MTTTTSSRTSTGRLSTSTLNALLRLGGVVAAFLLSALVLVIIGASPLDAFRLLVAGAGVAPWSPDKLAYVLTAWAPVMLCSAGLLLTFSAGLWNIGIEGQIVLGAICATGVLRAVQGSVPPALALVLAALGGMVGGGLWALLAGVLRLWGNVNEIFGGLGLNFIASSLTVYVVLGPWKRPGVGSTSGTQPFGPELWLPAIGKGFNVSLPEILLGIIAMLLVFLALRGTFFGLRLKAIGRNLRAAFIAGVPTSQYLLLAFALCGALAGLAGWMLVVGTSARHNLFPLVSSGYGFLAILVVLLANLDALWSIPISFFFAAIAMGSLQLALQRQLDSSLGGVIQGLLVLAILLAQGVQSRLFSRGR
jgi:general nucleoside transport system permease protein